MAQLKTAIPLALMVFISWNLLIYTLYKSGYLECTLHKSGHLESAIAAVNRTRQFFIPPLPRGEQQRSEQSVNV